ncbi:MAG: hypothetical protein JNG90_10695 [Planctomycetaceae bacterium]|nr:hypothetical protein [Planctomycetaceae bacterium]
MSTSWLLAALLLVAQGAETPEAPDKAALERTVIGLARELDAPERAKRDAAEQKLLELGAPALEVLPPSSARSSAELKQRLDRVRAVLEMARAEAFAQASHVTLAGEHKLSEILAALEKQTGNRVYDYREQFGQDATDPTLKVAFDKTPFWAAIDQLLDDAGLTLYAYADQPGLAVVNRGGAQLQRAKRAFYSGAFRFEPVEFASRRDLRNPENASLSLSLEISWEPRLVPLAIKQPLDDVEAVDDQGNKLAVSTAEGELEAPLDRGAVAVELPIPFALPPRSAAKIAKFTGTLTALVPGGLEKFTFTDLEKARNVEQRKAGVAVTLEHVRKNNQVWEARVRLRFDNRTGALESHRNWLASAQIYLVGADGKQIVPDASETTVSNEEELGMAFLFDRPQGVAGLSLVYQAPAVILTLPVEYELKDLELP